MCGITAYIGPRQAWPDLVTALERLEHLGRHSAGVALLGEQGIAVRRALGPTKELYRLLAHQPLAGSCAIAHTRGATIGAVTVENCHPHSSADGRIAVVHSGEVANHAVLRQELAQGGAVFAGDSDSEVIPHLLAVHYRQGGDWAAALQAVRAASARLRGGNAFAVLFSDHPGRIVAVRQGSPLVIGRELPLPAGQPAGPAGWWLSSDVHALRGFAGQVCALADGQLAELDRDGIRICTLVGAEVPAVFHNRGLAALVADLVHAARRLKQLLRSAFGATAAG